MGFKKPESKPAAPGLPHLEPADLEDPDRLAALFERAVRQGLVRRCAGDRLKFFAAAERARRVSTQNRCGFFAAFVRRGLWDFLSQADEDRAIERIKHHERYAIQVFQPQSRHAPNPSPADQPASEKLARTEVHSLISGLVSRLSMEPPPCLPSGTHPNVRRSYQAGVSSHPS